MDHRSFLKTLTPDEKRELTEKSNRAGFVHLMGHWGAILLMGSLIAARVPYWPLLLLPQGIALVFLFTLLHETSHRTVFRTLWLNKAVAWVCGLIIVLPPEWFRAFHFEHHRHTQDPHRDPELETPKPDGVSAYLRMLTGISIWRSHIATLLRNAFGQIEERYIADQAKPALRREAWAMLACYTALAVGSLLFWTPALLTAWLLPMLLGQPFLRLYLMAEHTGCPHVGDMFRNSRTTQTVWPIRALAWNMPFHAEHHAFPAVPFHKLPAFHDRIRAHIGTLEPGYTGFHRKFLAALSA